LGGNQDYVTTENLKARGANVLQNTLLMAGGMLAGKGLGGGSMGAGVGGALAAYATLPIKDLAQMNMYTGHEVVKSLHDMAAAQQTAANSPASTINVQTPEAPGMSTGQMAALGLGGAVVLGGGGYLASKLLEAMNNRTTESQRGRIQVTLPTRRKGDVETRLDLPMHEIPMSNALMGKVQRDFRSRLREETNARTRKVLLSPEEKERRAAVLARYRL
jgi:hypothetical protein